jgi:hypothetical protein
MICKLCVQYYVWSGVNEIVFRNLHLAFKIPFLYDYITKLCRQQTEVIQNHDNKNVHTNGQEV